MNRSLLTGAGLAVAVLAMPAGADEAARIRELERKLERSLQMIEDLSAKVRRLEQGAVTQPPAPASDQLARVETLERQVDQLGTGLSRRNLEEGQLLRGFADVGLGHSSEDNRVFGKGRKGFGIGHLDLYLTPQFGDRVRTLIELAFEVDDGHTEADLERAQLGYAFNDAAVAWLGRFHTPYGYWNTAFHHGAQLQTSIFRPRFLEFEEHTGILPAHTVGTWLAGSVLVDKSRVGYDIYAGNAQSIEVDASGVGKLRPRASGSTRHAYATGLNAWIEPGAVDGLRLGVHGLRSTIEDDVPVTPHRTRLGILGGYGVYTGGRWEVMGEYFAFRNRDLSGGSGRHRSWAGYVQAGYSFGRITPFMRYENAQLSQADNYFAVQQYGRSYRRTALGVRYELDPRAALKFELTNTDQADLGFANDRYSEARVQYSVRF